MDFIEIDKYTAVKLEYSEQYGYSLVEGWIPDDGNFTARKCKREFKKGTGEKQAPVAIKLGDRKHAEAALKVLLAQIEVPF